VNFRWAAAALGVVLAYTATAQVAILQIQVIEGEGGVYSPGARSNRPLVVEVTDETGRPVAGAAVSFHLPEDGPSGTFLNGLRTNVVVTDERGRATLRGMLVNRAPGRLEMRIIASKEQATAGIVSYQYIADPAAGGAGTAVAAGSRPAAQSPPAAASHGHGHKKWLIILAGAGAGAAAAVLAMHSGANSSAATAAESAPGTGAVPPAIGTPSITVGRP
jgi:hypothetical protein